MAVSEMIRRPPAALQKFTYEVLRKLGSDDEIASIVSAHLVRSNASGHDSHGMLRLPGYVESIDLKQLYAEAKTTIVRETPVAAVFDAHRGFGHYSTRIAANWVIEHAKKNGMAAAAIRHSHHIGRVGEYTELFAAAGLVGIATVGNAAPDQGNVVPFGGKGRFLGTNPWSFGFPSARGNPFVYDAATSSLAEGKLRVARSKNTPVPEGTLTDAAGNFTQDPNAYYNGGALTPLGGELFGHKGWGLGFAASLMGGLAMIDDPEPLRPSNAMKALKTNKGMISGAFVCAIDPGAFGPADRYKELVADSLEAARAEAPAPNFKEVLVAGDPESRLREQRGRDGIDLPEPIWKQLLGLSERFSIPLE